MNWKDFEISDGSYEDVRSVYDSLSPSEKNMVTPGRTVYKDIPSALFARTVAKANGVPVAFTDAWGPFKSFGRRPYFTIETAVSGNYRGKGLSPRISKETVDKVIRRIHENRADAKKRGFDSVKNEPDRIYWDFVGGNRSSEIAASKAGFKRIGRHRFERKIQ